MKKSLLRNKQENILILAELPQVGKGVLAREAIPRWTRIIEYKGTLRQNVLVDADDCYVCLMDLEDGWVIDPRKGGNYARFINHSCEPNCKLTQIGQRMFVDSIRNIPAGAELVYDYNLEIDLHSVEDPEKEKSMYRCFCGSKKCRGSMLSPELLK